HPVQISRPYYLGRYEVTQAQWQAVMGTAPWKGQLNVSPGDEYPATFITWEDAQAFCHELNDGENGKYRLPTEAEWEYACRAGSNTRFHFADDAGSLGDYAWFNLNAGDIGLAYAHEVGRKQPNPWSLYDMHGNVREWCYDSYVSYDHGQPASLKLIDPQGPASESRF
ncbi:MAG: formylglycine-generating enzyme family protein, partial [Verrucomicrobiae bacterium]|nr:formylglycine-generating enzyme family protein [Verrucomicrobiae bacterium]